MNVVSARVAVGLQWRDTVLVTQNSLQRKLVGRVAKPIASVNEGVIPTCCRIEVSPLVPELAATILTIGLFHPTYTPPQGGVPTSYSREIEEEGVSVNASLSENVLALTLMPAISHYAQHAGKRIAAGVMLEIAARYAAKCDGEVRQLANVQGCSDSGVTSRVLGVYPEAPLAFGNLCSGFQQVFVSEGETPP